MPPDKITAKMVRELFEDLGEGIHAAFRKAADCPESVTAWMAIRSMDTRKWESIVEFVREPYVKRILELIKARERA